VYDDVAAGHGNDREQPDRGGEPVTRRRRTHRRGRQLGGLGIAAAMIVAGAVGFLATSAFTATNTVPSTNLVSNTRTIGADDLKPAGCSSLSLTVIVTGSGNFNFTQAHALVLGSSAKNNIGDNGSGSGTSCIIGGAGADHVTGNSGDFCEQGPTPGAVYNSCTKF
jgi:hypothetical protein